MRWFPPATVCLIGWGVLAFGGEYAWAYAPLLVFAATIGLLGLGSPTTGRSESRLVILSVALLFGAVFLQLVPLPTPVLTALSPARLAEDWPALVAVTAPAAADPAPVTGPRTISIAPARTLLGVAFLAGLALFFAGCCRALGAVRASAVARGVIGLGLLVALLAIAQEASRSPLVYGFWWPRKIESLPAAPLINENHLAGWLVMAFSLALGYLCAGSAGRRFAGSPGWRPRAHWLASREGSTHLLVVLSLFVMAVATVFTRSVSGIVALLVVCGVCCGWASRRSRGRRLAQAALVAVPVAAIGWVGLDVVGAEVANASWSDLGQRAPIWRDTLRIVQDFPLAGTGLNTYGIAMLAYQTVRPDLHVVEAHNDYLQLAAEGGALLGLPVLIAVALFVRGVRARFREARDDVRIYWLRVGALAGLLALAVQSLVDFSLQMPGNAVLFALLMAIAVHRPPPAPVRDRS